MILLLPEVVLLGFAIWLDFLVSLFFVPLYAVSH